MQDEPAGASPAAEALLMEHEAKALARAAAVYTHPGSGGARSTADRVVVNWIFDFTGKDGITRRLNELALQTWRGDRVQDERFVYDTATAWQVVEGQS